MAGGPMPEEMREDKKIYIRLPDGDKEIKPFTS